MATGPSADERYVLDYHKGARDVMQSVEIASWEITDGVLTAVTPKGRSLVLSPQVEWVIEPADRFDEETAGSGWSLEE